MIDIKEELREYSDLIGSIDGHLRELDDWDTRQQKITYHLHPTAHIRGSSREDPREGYMEAVKRIRGEIDKDVIQLERKRDQLNKAVYKIPRLKLRNLIIHRYFRNKPWNEVAGEIKESVSYTFELHGKALQIMREQIREQIKKEP